MTPGDTSAGWQGVNLISKSESTSPNPTKREQWKRKIDFLFACVGFSVGFGNVWRFPYLCYRNGGGAFLIPYLVAVVVVGIPMFTLEVMLGQFMSEGGIQPWKIAPLLQGIGYATTIINFIANCEYNVILTWTLYYLFSSFGAVLPWSHCNNAWNTVSCTTFEDLVSTVNVSQPNHTMVAMVTVMMNASNHDFPASVSAKDNVSDARMDPVTEFWERKVLALSSGVGEPGAIKWDLALCLLLAWIIVYFCIWKGIKSSGKVMYFTASSPYIFMIVLLIRGVTLNGASLGIRYYLLPDWHRLQDSQVWVDAGTQIFFSYSIALGTLTALGSYNDFHHNCYRDSIFFAVVNTFTSFLAGFVIFSVLGSMAYRQNVDISQVAESGPGLAFIAYPEAVSHLPVAPLWSSFFFVMIFLIGIDSQFVGVEGFITAIVDLYPHILRRGYRKELFIAAVCIASYLVGLSMVTQGGVYVFQLFDYYSASRIVIVLGFFECITVAYVYGVNRFYDNVQMMLGFRLNLWMKLCWSAFTPLYTMVIFVIGCISYSEVTYKRKSLLYIYPQWAICVGWLLAAVSAIFIPIVLVYKILITPGTLLQRVQFQIMPRLRRYQLRPNDDLNKVVLVEEFIHNAPCQVESVNGVGESLLLVHAK